MRAACVVVVLTLSLSTVAAFGTPVSAQAEIALEAVAKRDQLIADQETLLNAYRCVFNVDTHAVPGGCSSGQPTQGPTQPGVFVGTPTQQDIDLRDNLIAEQEALLNVYRCQHSIDTELVPTGCPDSQTTQLGSASTYTAIAVGRWLLCAINTEGAITCWGFTASGITDAPEGTYTAIAIGSGHNAHSCAINTDGTITCWGENHFGQADPPEGTYTAISAGDWHSCAISTDHTATCWGENGLGQADAPEGTYTAISAGGGHSCAISTDGTISCWGTNNSGEADPPEGTYTAISAGYYHSCAIRADQTIACWGNNDFGQIDAPEGTYTTTAAGYSHSCAIRTDQTIACWDWTSNTPTGVSWTA